MDLPPQARRAPLASSGAAADCGSKRVATEMSPTDAVKQARSNKS